MNTAALQWIAYLVLALAVLAASVGALGAAGLAVGGP
jgi:hypothetical protein